MIRIPSGIDKYIVDSRSRFELEKNDKVLPTIFSRLNNKRKDLSRNDKSMNKTNFDSILQQQIKKISFK